MSSYVAPIEGAGFPKPPRPASAPSSPRSEVAKAAAQPAVALDTIPSSPPADVMAQVGTAAHAFDNLQAQQRGLHFVRDTHTGRIVGEVRDMAGNVVARVPPSKVLAVAGGAPLGL